VSFPAGGPADEAESSSVGKVAEKLDLPKQ